MSNFNTKIINLIIKNILYSDQSSVSSRASDIIINNNNLGFSIDITNIDIKEAEHIRDLIIKEIDDHQKFEKINIVLTSKKDKIHIEGVKEVVVIAAGKGGVGKSTITALLAHKLTKEGKKVGILDADIYGPSIPHLLSLTGTPDIKDKRMIPLENYNIQANSIGFLTAPDKSISWRGPMISKALYQLLSLTKWDNLDYLIIDTPPGTGDIHISLLENYIINKVIMVVTPQKIAWLDVTRSINLYNKFNVPTLGIIENMSYYVNPHTGEKLQIFAGDEANIIAQNNNIKVLTQLPIIPTLSLACDQGNDLKEFTNLLDFNL